MNPTELTVSGSAITTLLLELVKFVCRKLVFKNMDYDFPPVFYKIAVPVLNALMPFMLVYVFGIPSVDPILSMSIIGVVRYVALVALGSLGSFVIYENGVRPIKNYNNEYKYMRE